MWARTLLIIFLVAAGVGVCLGVARMVTRLGGRGALGTAFRAALIPLSVLIVCGPVLAMHGLAKSLAGMGILAGSLCLIFFTGGLVVGLWRESLSCGGPLVLDPTISLNRGVKKFFAVPLVAGLAAIFPFALALSASFIVDDLPELGINAPSLPGLVKGFLEAYWPVGAVAAAVSASSLSLSLFYDWTLGAVIEGILTRIARRS